MKNIALIGILFLLSIIELIGQDGTRDPSYGTQGFQGLHHSYKAFNLARFYDYSYGLSNFYFFGLERSGGGSSICLLKSNGALQPGWIYGNDGWYSNLPNYHTSCYVAVQNNSKLIAATSSSSSIRVWRWADSTLPWTDFHFIGFTDIMFEGYTTYCKGVLIDDLNRIVVLTRLTQGSEIAIGIVRLTPEGIPDSTFNATGKAVFHLSNSRLLPSDMVLRPDRGIVVASTGKNLSTLRDEILVTDILENGSLSSYFGTGGFAVFRIDSLTKANSVALQPDGKIVVGGYAGVQNAGRFCVVRFNHEGSPDPTFGYNGFVGTAFSGIKNEATAVCIQTDGKIIVAGITSNGNDQKVAIARYLTDGTLDEGYFGDDGRIEYKLGSITTVSDIILYPDSRIILAGTYWGDTPYTMRLKNGEPFVSFAGFDSTIVRCVTAVDTIRWRYRNVTTVKLELSIDGGTTWSVIDGGESIPVQDSFLVWTVPNTPSENCRIRISDVNNPNRKVVTPKFKIVLTPVTAAITTVSEWIDHDYDGYATGIADGSGSYFLTGIKKYEWFVDGVLVDTSAVVQFNLQTGTYKLKLVVSTSIAGFKDSMTVPISVYAVRKMLGGIIRGAVAQSGSMVYLTSTTNKVYAIDTLGNIQHTFLAGGYFISGVSITRAGNILAASEDNKVYALTHQLQQIWNRSVNIKIHSTPIESTDGKNTYVISYLGRVYAYNAQNGNKRWLYQTAGEVNSSPILLELQNGEKHLIFGRKGTTTNPASLIALKDCGDSAQVIWEVKTDGGVTSSPAFYRNNDSSMIYFVTEKGTLYRVRWDGYRDSTWHVYTGDLVLNISPVIDQDGYVYVGNQQNKLLAYDPNFSNLSSSIDSITFSKGVVSTPSIGRNGKMYVSTSGGGIHSINLRRKPLQVSWSFDAGSSVTAPMLVTESGLIVAATNDGYLHYFVEPRIPAEVLPYRAVWPAFLGNYQRNGVVQLTPLSTKEPSDLPKKYALNQNYPNPFNPETIISFSVPEQSEVSLIVYNTLGEVIRVLVNRTMAAGTNSVVFHGAGLPSGVYFYEMVAKGYREVKKMVVIR